MLEMMQAIAPARGKWAKRGRLDARKREKPFDPRFDWDIEVDPSGVHKKSDLPGGDRAEEDHAIAPPAAVDQAAGRWPQASIAAVEPEGDMGVEKKPIRQRAVSLPVSASGATSRAGAIRSTPRLTRTEPRCAPKREPARSLSLSSRRMASATASVLLPPVSLLAASSISATTSGRLMVTTCATATPVSLNQY